MGAQSGDVQPLVHLWRNRGQAQEPAEEPGAAAGADQHGKAGCVAVAHPGQVDDEPAGAGAEQAEKLLAQRRGAGDVKSAAQLGDRAMVLLAARIWQAAARPYPGHTLAPAAVVTAPAP